MIPSIYEYTLVNNMIITEEGEYVTILEWIEQYINKIPDKELTVDFLYMKKILGPEFIMKNDDAIYRSLRNSLKKYNIIMKRWSCLDGKTKLTMKFFR